MAGKRGRGRGLGIGSTLKTVGIMLMVVYTIYFMLVFYSAFSNDESYTAILDINSLGGAFLWAALLVPLTVVLIVVGLFFSFREKARLNANLSYEVRTSLTNILGYAEVLQGGHHGRLNPRQEEMLEVIHRNGGRILETIGDLESLRR